MSEECYDINGRQILAGDLLRSYHFTDRRRRRHYLYHTAVMRDGTLWMVPTSHLEPTKADGGGSCRCSLWVEIISGYGPNWGDSFLDRPKHAGYIRPDGSPVAGTAYEARIICQP